MKQKKCMLEENVYNNWKTVIYSNFKMEYPFVLSRCPLIQSLIKLHEALPTM